MSFYVDNHEMGSFLKRSIQRFEKESRPGLHNNISVTWVYYGDIRSKNFSRGIGTGWLENKLVYPASVVKLFYACAIEKWLYKDLLVDTPELHRALGEMIVNSSNDATGYIVDLLTGTTSGPCLQGLRWKLWKKQRNIVNDWVQSFNWNEFKALNCCQKTWTDGPFGRDRDFYGLNNHNRNALTTIATARLLEALMTGNLLTHKSTKRLKTFLFRSLDLIQRKADTNNQIDGFLGEGLPKATQLWSKAGLMSEARHDAAWLITPKGKTMMIIVFTKGKALSKDNFLLPALANELVNWNP